MNQVLRDRPSDSHDLNSLESATVTKHRLSGDVAETLGKLCVLKLGSSVLATQEDYPKVAHEIYRWIRDGFKVVAVVSAMGSTTDQLLAEASAAATTPLPETLATFLATGEWLSAAQLGLALDRAGISVRVLDSAGLGLQTTGPILDARCHGLNVTAIQHHLLRYQVLVVPGFVGNDSWGGTTLLGRGGTDLSAIFIAEKLQAEQCILLKDVDGLYDRDPAQHPQQARRFESVSFEDVLSLEEGIVQHKAVHFAQKVQGSFSVGTLLSCQFSKVSAEPSRFSTLLPQPDPLQVYVSGEDALAAALSRQLRQFPQHFCVAHVGLNALGAMKVERAGKSRGTVLVDLGSDANEGFSLCKSTLEEGFGIISANTACMAEFGLPLKRIASSLSLPFSCHAAVGGAVPILEIVTALAGNGQIRRFEAVFSGTCNFILEETMAGKPFDEAVVSAKLQGLTHPDIDQDLSGADSLHKLLICANHGLGLGLKKTQVVTTPLSLVDPSWYRLAREGEAKIRYVSLLEVEPQGFKTQIQPTLVDPNHPFASLPGDYNGFLIHLRDGRSFSLKGRGTGAEPLAISLTADLIGLFHSISQKPEPVFTTL